MLMLARRVEGNTVAVFHSCCHRDLVSSLEMVFVFKCRYVAIDSLSGVQSSID